jgi:hypothetical protein
MRGSVKGVPRGHYRQYTASQRDVALQEADRLGLRGAAAKCRVPMATLSYWIKRARMQQCG